MGIRNWITGKQYILVNRTIGDEEVGTFPASRSVQQIKAMIASGDLEDAVYRLVCRSRKGDKVQWTMPTKKVLTAAKITVMEREKAFKALREKTESVKKDVEELRLIKSQMMKEFGDETGVLPEEIQLPDETSGLFDMIGKATAESAYISIRRNPDKTTEAMFGVVDAATSILTGIGNMIAMKVADKTVKHANTQVKTMDKEVKIDGDKKTVRFKNPTKDEVIDVEPPTESSEELEMEEVPEEDGAEYVTEEEIEEEK
jgi:hypothetical protein